MSHILHFTVILVRHSNAEIYRILLFSDSFLVHTIMFNIYYSVNMYSSLSDIIPLVVLQLYTIYQLFVSSLLTCSFILHYGSCIPPRPLKSYAFCSLPHAWVYPGIWQRQSVHLDRNRWPASTVTAGGSLTANCQLSKCRCLIWMWFLTVNSRWYEAVSAASLTARDTVNSGWYLIEHCLLIKAGMQKKSFIAHEIYA